MDEFIIVLAIGLAIIAILALFSFVPGELPGKPAINKSIGSFSLETVGSAKSAPIESINLGAFTAGTTQDKILKSASYEEISASLVGGTAADYEINIDSDSLSAAEKVVIEFQVNETNHYNSLVVLWNGEPVFEGLAEKEYHSIEVPKGEIKQKNNLKIKTSPSWRFWASTVYVLKNINIKGEFGKDKVTVFSLSQDEFDKFDRGEIGFSLVGSRTGEGKLIIKVNGKEIYKQSPKRIENINFTHKDADLNVGNNIVSFRAENGFFELENVNLDIYTLSSNIVKKRGFELTQEQFDSLDKKNGAIKITIARILKPGNLEVKINGKSLHITPKPGLNELEFDKSYVSAGPNQIEFSSRTGAFEISEVEIRV